MKTNRTMMLIFLSFGMANSAEAAQIACESWNYKPALCDTKIKNAVVTLGVVEKGAEKLCPPTNWSTTSSSTGTTVIQVINGCRASFNVVTPSPSPSPTAKIYLQTDSGNQQAPQAFFVSALPPVPHLCWTDGEAYVGPEKAGTYDSETKIEIYHTPPQSGDFTGTVAHRAAIRGCIRSRDMSYNAGISQDLLQGGSVLGSNYSWDFGDPVSDFNQVQGMSAGHVYQSPGTYTIRLTLRTDNGRTITGTQGVVVKPSTRRIVTVDTQAQFDALFNDKQTDGRKIQLKRGAQFNMSKGLDLRTDDWVTSPGTGALPILWTAFTSGGKMFYLGVDSIHHVQVDSLELRTKPGTPRLLVSEPSGKSIVFKDIVFSRGPNWVGPSRAFTLQGSGALLQNVGPPLGANGQPQSAGLSQNFVFIMGSNSALYGNRGFVSQADGNSEPGWRACGTIENTSIVGNTIGGWFGKASVISMRGGHNTYFGNNHIYGGVFNFQGGCSPAETPSTTNTNILVENNVQENNAFQMNPSVYNVMYRNNKSWMELVPASWKGAQEPILFSGYNNWGTIITTNPVTIENNEIRFEQTYGKIFQFSSVPAGQITVTGNKVISHLSQGRPIYTLWGSASLDSFLVIRGNSYSVPAAQALDTVPMSATLPFSKWNGAAGGKISSETMNHE